MGFFDFIGKAVGAVKNLISEPSGIVSSLGSLAGMVAHAIPGVGPIVDVAVPALQAVFSDGSAPSSAPQERLEQPANIINLDRSDKIISEVLTNCQKIQDTLYVKIEDAVKQLGQDISNLQKLIRHDKFTTLRVQVVSAVKFMDSKQDVLKQITASSGPSAFEQIFPTGGDPAFTQERLTLSKTIDNIKADLEDTFFVPSQDMLELYLFSIHWLMLYDKETWGQYTAYLKTLGYLKSDIYMLRRDAREAYDTLKQLGQRLTEKREEAVSQVTVTIDNKTRLQVHDSWQILGIGWKTQQDVAKAVNMTTFDVVRTETTSEELKNLEQKLADSNLKVYQDVIVQTLQVYLQPCNAVIESLEDSMRNWKARLPVSPMKLKEDQKHATPEEPKEDENCPADAESILWERNVAYAVTYVNTYGESPESEWSDSVEIPQKCTTVKVKLENVQFEGDFTAGLKLVKKDGKKVPRDRGIRRRVYIQYTDKNQNLMMERIGELSEADEWFTHNVLDTKKKQLPGGGRKNNNVEK